MSLDRVMNKNWVMKKERAKIQDLLEIMVRLRDPDTGCPWDAEQDFTTIAPYTI